MISGADSQAQYYSTNASNMENFLSSHMTEDNIETIARKFLPPIFCVTDEQSFLYQSSYENEGQGCLILGEFCQVVGPKAILYYPHRPENKIYDDLMVKVMSVDFLHTDHKSSFSLNKPTFVLALNEKIPYLAYYFTLYDVEARGHVRPFCLCYLICNSNSLLQRLQSVEQTMRSFLDHLLEENLRHFRSEMTHYLQCLKYSRELAVTMTSRDSVTSVESVETIKSESTLPTTRSRKASFLSIESLPLFDEAIADSVQTLDMLTQTLAARPGLEFLEEEQIEETIESEPKLVSPINRHLERQMREFHSLVNKKYSDLFYKRFLLTGKAILDIIDWPGACLSECVNVNEKKLMNEEWVLVNPPPDLAEEAAEEVTEEKQEEAVLASEESRIISLQTNDEPKRKSIDETMTTISVERLQLLNEEEEINMDRYDRSDHYGPLMNHLPLPLKDFASAFSSRCQLCGNIDATPAEVSTESEPPINAATSPTNQLLLELKDDKRNSLNNVIPQLYANFKKDLRGRSISFGNLLKEISLFNVNQMIICLLKHQRLFIVNINEDQFQCYERALACFIPDPAINTSIWMNEWPNLADIHPYAIIGLAKQKSRVAMHPTFLKHNIGLYDVKTEKFYGGPTDNHFVHNILCKKKLLIEPRMHTLVLSMIVHFYTYRTYQYLTALQISKHQAIRQLRKLSCSPSDMEVVMMNSNFILDSLVKMNTAPITNDSMIEEDNHPGEILTFFRATFP